MTVEGTGCPQTCRILQEIGELEDVYAGVDKLAGAGHMITVGDGFVEGKGILENYEGHDMFIVSGSGSGVFGILVTSNSPRESRYHQHGTSKIVQQVHIG